MRKLLLTGGWLLLLIGMQAQSRQEQARLWADSVLRSLSPEQRIAQLLIIRAHSNLGPDHVNKVSALIQRYNVGGLCFFQGGPVRQAQLTNQYQQLAKTPLLISIDAEWGLGMRLDSVLNLPRQLMLGAAPNASFAYEYGKILGQQCRRMGIQVNYAPVVDVNNNPNNPVINDRSLGEDKYKVALFGTQLMKGMQEMGVMACAKHFPGHGDTETDSHYDLPIILKTRPELDSLELYPFRELFRQGVGSVMIGHLYIPSIDNTKNLATSLSYNNVTKLLREELQFRGLAVTDALEMQGVKKFFPDGKASVQALLAGNDLLCLPGDVPQAIDAIKKALRKKQLRWADINSRVHRVLMAKYLHGLGQVNPIVVENLVQDLNAGTVAFNRLLAEHTITLLKNEDALLPLNASTFAFLGKVKKQPQRIAYVAIGATTETVLTKKMRSELKADVYFFGYNQDGGRVPTLIEMMENNYDLVVIGLHNYSRRPAKQFGISTPAMQLAQGLLKHPKSVMLLLGNPYAARYVCDARHLVTSYEDNDLVEEKVFELLTGKIQPQGTLPVTVCASLPHGSGLLYKQSGGLLPYQRFDATLFSPVDSIVNDAIDRRAMPGCVVVAVKDGAVVFEKAYGYLTYDTTAPVTVQTVYDMASVTKILATTLAVMKLYEEGKLDLKQRLGYYLPWVNGSDKQDLLLEDILLHQAGLKSWIPFYKEVTDVTTGVPQGELFATGPSENFTVQVADTFFMRGDWVDTMYQRILQSEKTANGTYIYSDNDFIFLGKIVEQLTGMTLDAYVRTTFYEPMDLHATGFLPRNQLPLNRIAPTEQEKLFRRQLIRGYVHDPGAAMFGGVAGHAGLFSTAYEQAVLMQMLANGGRLGDKQFFQPETIALFTAYGSNVSRRGLGFDKPEKDNATRKEPYPAAGVSSATFGHTGFTGTCAWADPEHGIVFVFLSNRVHPDGANNQLLSLRVRGKIQEALYKILLPK